MTEDEKIIAELTPEQQEIFKVELIRQNALSENLKILTETKDRSERNLAALALLKLKNPEHLDYHVTAKLIEMVLDPKTKNARGTLLHVLREMEMPIKSSVLTKILIENTGEAFEEAMEFFEIGLLEPTGDIAEQIAELEIAMRETTDEHRKNYFLDAHTMLTELSMVPIQLPFDSKFRNIPWSIAIIKTNVKQIAENIGFELDQWEEDGLGNQSGFGAILPTGLWVIFREDAHLVGRGITTGPTIDIDVDAASNVKNLPTLLNEVLTAFGLTEDEVQTKRTGFDTWSD